ncbi:hypothetical protein BAUCODRAFT_69032 [Baudoinia panamericana UAMH 10762]|uniref:AAA+ ATPase domain-containing protein n=1 Tax=Baudoinia panamericana (strain UAMH 10762) TaxID=717646 RepID=M2NE35_BAUPA|nr:uncharacterized protein BAUCODRAFT_69032 [Baudoinia panamericana UAMH 10762]EMC97200.1 hypothetical protein BAUCODRAFT_69032 [Baudoinia panamericana UAMH 10762]
MAAAAATGLSITNPLIKYRALVATKQIVPDHAQLRLALHLQKLYDRLKDYEPQVEYSARLDQISKAVNAQRTTAYTDDESPPSASKTWRTLLAAKQQRDSLALTRRLTSHESALQLTSPKGLMLHGEVGTGKSMLIDLFADSLPTRKKRRWHFNTFMLETFAKLEALRRSRTMMQTRSSVGANDDDSYSLLWLAKDMVQTSPILFLDEFQMPDRVASKILTNLMTSFFHLGGVLIATSNRMPEELARAAGEDFPLPVPSRLETLGWQFGVFRRKERGYGLFGGANEFAAFLEVLKARCEVWEMASGKDYRRLESGSVLDGHDDMQHSAGMPGWPAAERPADSVPEQVNDGVVQATAPRYFNVLSGDNDQQTPLQSAIATATGQAHLDSVPWQSATLRVYGRTIPVPRSCNGATLWTFDELCKTSLGPADYITLASSYHTLILTDVPVMTWLMKNEARRLITLLDALYECRCKLFVSAAAGPDDIFFPEKKGDETENGDSVYSETISEVYQDATAPFRPNILSQNPNYAEPDPEPDYTHARLAGLLNADALEDDPPNKPAQRRSPFDEPRYTAPRSLDFGKTSAFTGEDERFAYKRAQSRLWEMCGSRWWARAEPDWHRPLPLDVRRWERTIDEQDRAQSPAPAAGEPAPLMDGSVGLSTIDSSRDERSFRYPDSFSPFRASNEPPPKFSWTHIWSMAPWGPKAGRWGQGVEGSKKSGSDKR